MKNAKLLQLQLLTLGMLLLILGMASNEILKFQTYKSSDCKVKKLVFPVDKIDSSKTVYSEKKGMINHTVSGVGEYKLTIAKENRIEDQKGKKIKANTGKIDYLFQATVQNTRFEDTKELAQVSLDSFVNNIGGELIHDTTYTVSKYEGVQGIIVQGEKYIRYGAVLTNLCYYQLVVTYSIGKPSFVDIDNADVFFNSFRIIR